MALAKILSERKEYTKADPLKIRLDMGVHEIVGNGKVLNVTCSHITFVGTGKSQTTIRGGFRVENQQNVTFEELVVTNPTRYGMRLHGSETNVDLLKCVVKVVDTMECMRSMVPLSPQHNVHLREMVDAEHTAVQIQQQD
jgi:pectate lyase